MFSENVFQHLTNPWDAIELLVQVLIISNFTIIYTYHGEVELKLWVFNLQAFITMLLWF